MNARLKLSGEALRDLAQAQGVCVRPIVHEVHDRETGADHVIPLPCGSRQARACEPCAEKARRLRMHQCREGWHLSEEPERVRPRSGEPDEEELKADRRVRSTRRRQDAPDLPRRRVEDRTVGRAFVAPNGRVYRPSMFATFTLPSYGRVRPDGTPVDPATYDYRRAALDAMHFPKLVDRVWQNLRRALGYKVQYFAAVEPQRRLAPHLHAAIRGAVPRALIRDVVDATYHQVWWPQCQEVVYDGQLPIWDVSVGYVDPTTGAALPSWEAAVVALEDEDAQPAHVLRLGHQVDVQGIIATEGDADRRVGYLTKYLAKSFTEAFAGEASSQRQRAHADRLHEEVRWMPCSPRCANWLRFGVQPKDAAPAMFPGGCKAKIHDADHLGCGGRRVLVSRLWTGKTLRDHRADRAEVVRQVLLEAGIEAPEIERLAASVRKPDGTQRFEWRVYDPLDATVPIYRQVLTRSITEHLRWTTQYEAAKSRASPRAGPVPSSRQPAPLVGVAPVQGERSESRSDTSCP